MTVLVAGATGTTGAAVVRELVAATVPVRALSRSADRAAALTGPGVEAVAASVDDPDALRAAFDGVEAAYLVTPSTPTMAATEGAFARIAAEAGAHLVKLSVLGAAPDSPLRFARGHAESEAAIAAAGGTGRPPASPRTPRRFWVGPPGRGRTSSPTTSTSSPEQTSQPRSPGWTAPQGVGSIGRSVSSRVLSADRIVTQPSSRLAASGPSGRPSWVSDRKVTPGNGMGGSMIE